MAAISSALTLASNVPVDRVMTTRLRITSVLAVATLIAGPSWIPLAPAASANGLAAQAQHDHADTTAAPTSDSQMMKMRQDMMARMKKGDDRVQTLVTAMNKATGEAKIAAMVALLTVLANERPAMRDGMMQMQSQMMAQMMDMRKGIQDAMATCSMMPQTPGKD